MRRGGIRRPGDRVQLLEFRERQRACVRRGKQQPPVAAGDEQEVGHDLEHGGDFIDQDRTARCVLLDEDPAGAITLRQNPGRQIGFRLNAPVEVLVGGAAAGEIQDNRKDRDAEDERGGVPDRQPTANAFHATS